MLRKVVFTTSAESRTTRKGYFHQWSTKGEYYGNDVSGPVPCAIVEEHETGEIFTPMADCVRFLDQSDPELFGEKKQTAPLSQENA